MTVTYYIEITGRTGQPSRVGPFADVDALNRHIEENHTDADGNFNGKGEFRFLQVTEEEFDPTVADEGEEGEEGEGDGYDDLTAAELQDLCRERGLAVSGNKSELIQRLRDADNSTEE